VVQPWAETVCNAKAAARKAEELAARAALIAAATEAGHQVDPRTVIRAYNGGQGCACGCKGTYAELDENGPSKALLARVAKVNLALATDRDSVEVTRGYRETIYCLDGATRATRVYVSDFLVEAVARDLPLPVTS
jgi:hypothetical protein